MNVIQKIITMERLFNIGKAFLTLFLIMLLRSFTVAKESAKIDSDADSGILTGSPWLWLLFVAILIIIIVILSKGRRNS